MPLQATIPTMVTPTVNTPQPKQRRCVPRISVDFPVILILGKKQFLCRARQLSEFGTFVTPAKKELIRETIQVDLFLELPKTLLSLPGIVVYAADGGIGIRFTGTSPEQQYTLKRYVQARGIGTVKS